MKQSEEKEKKGRSSKRYIEKEYEIRKGKVKNYFSSGLPFFISR